MKKIICFMSVIVAVLMFGQGVSAEEISSNKLSGKEKSEVIEAFDKLDIDKEIQRKLIEKVENGEILDAMKEENLQKVVNDMENVNLNDSKTITFKDGSKIKYGTELVNDSSIQPMASAGSYTAKSYWYTGILNYSYYNDFVIRSGKNNDYIKRAYNPSVTMLGPGSYKDVKTSIQRKNETSTRFAYSRMSFNYSVPTGSSTVRLYFNVGNNTYKTTLSQKDSK